MSESTPDRLVHEIEQVMNEETLIYRRLLRRAHRVQRYMVQRESRRLLAMSEELAALIPRARRLASKRAALVEAWGRSSGRSGSVADLLKLLLVSADTRSESQLRASHDAVASAADALYRKNFENHQLASYSSELVREEISILGGSQPSGSNYDAGGERQGHLASGMVDGRA